ncbi:MAG: alpha/beta hydrolase fold domain-containing protein [Phycisphaeraceae bacterium]|nr:alpha/beta hydrolase fold domain-containing protein [Phycisphaeraceae bacterium]
MTTSSHTPLGRWLLSAVMCCAFSAGLAHAAELHVNHQTGSDDNPGSPDAPLKTIAQAVSLAQPGDVIHLLPEGGVYREMISLIDKSDLTIEGHDCVLTGADPLPADPAAWEEIEPNLHRIRLDRTQEDRHILVVDGRAQIMGRTKHNIMNTMKAEREQGWEAAREALIAQYPKPHDLRPGQFAWEPIDPKTGWLYVRGPLDNLEWAVRTQGVYTFMHTHNVTIRNLHVRHVLNDGFNFHGDTQNIRLVNVSGNECFDNGVSPHAACSMSVENSNFRGNSIAVGNGHMTRARMVNCTISDSVDCEVMVVGGQQVFEGCTIRATGPAAMRFIVAKPTQPYLLKEIEMAGKTPEQSSDFMMRRCTVESADNKVRPIVVGPGVNLRIAGCTFRNVHFQIDEKARVQVTNSTLDGEPLRLASYRDPDAEPAPPSTPATYGNVSYGPHPRNILNIWLAKSDKPTPLVIRIHGGGFLSGRPTAPMTLQQYLDAGVSVASITYRFSSDAPYPAPMLDSARAVQFLRSKAQEWNLDPTRFASTGGSAGGGISLWLGFHDDLADPNSPDPVARQSTRLTCMAVLNTQTSYDPRFIRANIPGPGWQAIPLWKLYGLDGPTENPSPEVIRLFEDASPINYLTADDPPVRLTYTWSEAEDDLPETPSIHHPKFGRILKARLDELGIANEFEFSVPQHESPADVAFILRHFHVTPPQNSPTTTPTP